MQPRSWTQRTLTNLYNDRPQWLADPMDYLCFMYALRALASSSP